MAANSPEARGGFATDAGQAMGLKKHLAGSPRCVAPPEFCFHKMRTDKGNFPTETFTIREILPTIDASGGRAEEAHGKYAALVGVDVAGGPEHGVFASKALRPEERQQSFGRQTPCGCSHAVEDGKPGSNGGDAGVEGHPTHVTVGAVVQAIHEAGLGSQFYFLQKRLADKGAYGFGPVLSTFPVCLRHG
jgi:hypothetical protein